MALIPGADSCRTCRVPLNHAKHSSVHCHWASRRGNTAFSLGNAPEPRREDGELDGSVRVVDFIAVHLDAVLETSVPDPNDPQDNGKTIDIELLVGTVVQVAISGSAANTASGVVEGMSVSVPTLIR